MAGVEKTLKNDFPEATDAECKRFVNACQDPKKDADAVKAEAEKMLEDYLDWRSCYGLDYKKDDMSDDQDDAEDWNYAIRKAIEVNESVKRAQELERELKKNASKDEAEEEKPKVSYDIDLSDSQKEASEGENAKEDTSEKEETEQENDKDGDDTKKEPEVDLAKILRQMVFLHNDKEGKPIVDKNGNKILHILPGLINRVLGGADIYGLAFTFYLDRKFDRKSDEKVTLLVDLRAGEGWPNPRPVMMIKFVRAVVRQLQLLYPERVESLVLFPLPRAAYFIWNTCKTVFQFRIMEKISVVTGPAGRDDPLPKDEMLEFMDEKVMEITEEARQNTFLPIGSYSDEP